MQSLKPLHAGFFHGFIAGQIDAKDVKYVINGREELA